MFKFADDINMFWNVGYTADRQNAHDDLIKVDGLKNHTLFSCGKCKCLHIGHVDMNRHTIGRSRQDT